MNDNSFTTIITVGQTPEEAFAAINDPRRWWKGAFEGPTDVLGGEFTYRYQDIHFSKQQVTELAPGRKVVWTVTDSALQFVEHKDEWTGTKLVFDIARKGDKTEVRFTQVGLVPDCDCYGACSKGWTQLLQELGALIASKGQPGAKVTFGNHSAVRVRRAERARIREFYRDVLGCKLTRQFDDKDDFRIGDDFHIAFLYESGHGVEVDQGVTYAADDALADDDFLKAIFLELKADKVEEMRQKIVSFGVRVLEVPDVHLYFQAPGGQVFRLVGTNEDLSRYEGIG